MDKVGTPENTTLFTRTGNKNSQSKHFKILVQGGVPCPPPWLDLAKPRPCISLLRWCPSQQARAGSPGLPDISVASHMLFTALQSHSLGILQGNMKDPVDV